MYGISNKYLCIKIDKNYSYSFQHDNTQGNNICAFRVKTFDVNLVVFS